MRLFRIKVFFALTLHNRNTAGVKGWAERELLVESHTDCPQTRLTVIDTSVVSHIRNRMDNYYRVSRAAGSSCDHKRCSVQHNPGRDAQLHVQE